MNQINIIGRVGKEPEVKNIGSTTVAKFSLAVSEKYTKDGERVEKTEWFNVAIFGKLSEVVEKYVHKGDMLFLSGKITSHEYEKNGVKQRSYEVNANTMELLGGKKHSEETESAEIFPAKSESSDPFAGSPYAEREIKKVPKTPPLTDAQQQAQIDDSGLPF